MSIPLLEFQEANSMRSFGQATRCIFGLTCNSPPLDNCHMLPNLVLKTGKARSMDHEMEVSTQLYHLIRARIICGWVRNPIILSQLKFCV